MSEPEAICTQCPRLCRVNRRQSAGFCHSGNTMHIAHAAPHLWEEPCLSGRYGAGTVFFSGCSLQCVFCQNHQISRCGQTGQRVTPKELADIFLDLQHQKVHNIDLVTPTHHRENIQAALCLARQRGLRLPVVWNTGGYETTEAVTALQHDVTIWLFDLKFYSEALSRQYANAADYFAVASAALLQAAQQTGPPVLDGQGLLQRGVVVRLLVLPGHRQDAKQLLTWLSANLPKDSFLLSLMSQYTPPAGLTLPAPLQRRLSSYEYNDVADTALALGFEAGYFQQRSSAGEEYVPPFSLA